jgi:hypothetical protein
MNAHDKRQNYASSLLADLKANRSTLPRQEALTGWLQDYVRQARSTDREPDAALATENLLAINAHLAAFGITATARPALN